jgi:hypothetical protein
VTEFPLPFPRGGVSRRHCWNQQTSRFKAADSGAMFSLSLSLSLSLFLSLPPSLSPPTPSFHVWMDGVIGLVVSTQNCPMAPSCHPFPTLILATLLSVPRHWDPHSKHLYKGIDAACSGSCL